MTRATLARVIIACFGDLPPGIEEAAVTAMLDRVDYKIDSITYPNKISETSDLAIEIAVDIVLLEIDKILWLQAGGELSGKPRPSMMPQSILLRIANLNEDADNDFGKGDMI